MSPQTNLGYTIVWKKQGTGYTIVWNQKQLIDFNWFQFPFNWFQFTFNWFQFTLNWFQFTVLSIDFKLLLNDFNLLWIDFILLSIDFNLLSIDFILLSIDSSTSAATAWNSTQTEWFASLHWAKLSAFHLHSEIINLKIVWVSAKNLLRKQLDTIVYPPNKPYYCVSGLLMDYPLEKLFEWCFWIGF